MATAMALLLAVLSTQALDRTKLLSASPNLLGPVIKEFV